MSPLKFSAGRATGNVIVAMMIQKGRSIEVQILEGISKKAFSNLKFKWLASDEEMGINSGVVSGFIIGGWASMLPLSLFCAIIAMHFVTHIVFERLLMTWRGVEGASRHAGCCSRCCYYYY
jgi:hypothetical protein